MRVRYFSLLLVLMSFACKKDKVPKSPEGAILVFPLQNSECNTGISVNETLSQVTFEWQPAANTELYVLSAENWLFYNAGPQINYAPFPAQILLPASGRTVQMNQNNQVLLRWSGADIEDDIIGFEVFFSETNPPTTLLSTTVATTMEVFANVSSGTTYYWSVITTDSNGNTSDSGIYDFKVL